MEGMKELVENFVEINRELIEAKLEVCRMQGMIQAIVKTIDQKEVSEAKSKYSDREDVEETTIQLRELKALIGMRPGICAVAEEILKKREAENGK